MAVHRYVCTTCGAAIERPFRAPSVVRACENGCGFDHLVRVDLLDLVDRVPEAARPDDWDERPVEEQFRLALREGVVTLDDLR